MCSTCVLVLSYICHCPLSGQSKNQFDVSKRETVSDFPKIPTLTTRTLQRSPVPTREIQVGVFNVTSTKDLPDERELMGST